MQWNQWHLVTPSDTSTQWELGITAVPLYLEPPVMRANFLCQNRIESIEHFLLQAAVHQNMNNFPLLLVFQS